MPKHQEFRLPHIEQTLLVLMRPLLRQLNHNHNHLFLDYYNKELANVFGVQLLKQYGEPSFWIYTIKVLFKEDFIKYMK
jgi:hypothetical protein